MERTAMHIRHLWWLGRRCSTEEEMPQPAYKSRPSPRLPCEDIEPTSTMSSKRSGGRTGTAIAFSKKARAHVTRFPNVTTVENRAGLVLVWVEDINGRVCALNGKASHQAALELPIGLVYTRPNACLQWSHTRSPRFRWTCFCCALPTAGVSARSMITLRTDLAICDSYGNDRDPASSRRFRQPIPPLCWVAVRRAGGQSV